MQDKLDWQKIRYVIQTLMIVELGHEILGEIQVTKHYWFEFGDFALKQFQGYGMKCFRVMNRGLLNGFVIVVNDLFINTNF